MLLNTCCNVAVEQTLLFRCPSSRWGWGRASQCGPTSQPPSPRLTVPLATLEPSLCFHWSSLSQTLQAQWPPSLALAHSAASPRPPRAKLPRASLWVWVPAQGASIAPCLPSSGKSPARSRCSPHSPAARRAREEPTSSHAWQLWPWDPGSPEGATPAMLRTQCRTQGAGCGTFLLFLRTGVTNSPGYPQVCSRRMSHGPFFFPVTQLTSSARQYRVSASRSVPLGELGNKGTRVWPCVWPCLRGAFGQKTFPEGPDSSPDSSCLGRTGSGCRPLCPGASGGLVASASSYPQKQALGTWSLPALFPPLGLRALVTGPRGFLSKSDSAGRRDRGDS